jgi:hypothetical protein
MMMRDLKQSLLTGSRKGGSGFLWVLKILIPISFLTSLLEWSGVIHQIDFLFRPVMHWLGLPAVAAFPLLISIVTGIYGGIAAMNALPFTRQEMTLIAIFMMIAHNLIQEGMIQGRSGIHPLKVTLFRLGTAVFTSVLVARFLGMTPERSEVLRFSVQASPPFLFMLKSWGLSVLSLALRIFFIMIPVMVLLEILKRLGWIHPIVRFLTPVLKLLGLSPRVGLLWITGAFFGVAYGAAIILREVEEGNLSKEDLEGLHLSIGINHSVVEDPALFMSMGIHPFWLYIPRTTMAMLVVRLHSLWQSRSTAYPR